MTFFSSALILLALGSVLAEELNTDTLRSRHMRVTSSSQHPDTGAFAVSHAVDGSTSTVSGCNCCAATQNQNQPWIQIDLGRLYRIKRLEVIGRTDWIDVFAGMHLYVHSSPSTWSQQHTERVTIPSGTDDYLNYYNFELNGRPIGRYVTLQLAGNNVLLCVCEVKVYSRDCRPGTYGPKCDKTCGYCQQGEICDHVTGTCTRCQAGYRGNTCQDSCTAGTFGLNCGSRCHCHADRTCDHVTGECPDGRCDLAWQGLNCSEECKPGTYGGNCNNTCGYCLNNAICDERTGQCISCASGYTKPMCTDECPFKTYGQNCSLTCGQCVDTCNSTTGICLGDCQPGYQGTYCNSTCSVGFYGVNCNNSCGHCTNNETCNRFNGSCEEGCTAGYFGDKCYKECLNGTYGEQCNETCGHCRDDKTCNLETGSCAECAAGYIGRQCKDKCPTDTYGEECNETCGRCRESNACDFESGSCDECDIGYTGPQCKDKCRPGRYGQDCSMTCGHCRDICDSITGVCPGDCLSGYQGVLCKDTCPSDKFGQNCSMTCGHCLNRCDVITGVCTTGCLPGHQGALCMERYNIVQESPVVVSMSSVHQNLDATKAIDGMYVDNPVNCGCCSVTLNAYVSWWQAAFGKPHFVGQINIFGRENEDIFRQLDGFGVLTSLTGVFNEEPVYLLNTTLVNNAVSIYLSDVPAKYVRIQRFGILTICEIEIFQSDKRCPDNTYGRSCDPCGGCKIRPCDRVTGHCPGGCGNGHDGDLCQISTTTTSSSLTAAIVGGAIGIAASMFVAVIAITAFCLIQRRKSSRKHIYEETRVRWSRRAPDELAYVTLETPESNACKEEEYANVN